MAKADIGSGDTSDGDGGFVSGAIWAGVQFGAPPGGSGGGGGGASACTWRIATPHDAGIGTGGPVTRVVSGITYTLFERSCAGTTVVIWIPQPSGGQLAQQAGNVVLGQLPVPVPRTAPPASSGVVNAGMWFWHAGAWSPYSVTAWVPTPTGVLWATTTATPVGLVYNGGDAITPVSCSGPGTAWTPAHGDDVWTSCMYIYGHAGQYPAQLGIRWSVTYTSNAGSSGSLGTHVTWAPSPVSVDEIQALVTS